MADQVYIYKNGQKHGPLTRAKLQEYLSTGKLTSQDLIWYEGLEDWTPFGQTKEFSATPPPLRKSPSTSSTPVRAFSSQAPESRAIEPVAGKYCHACGATIDRRAEICPKCGVRQPSEYSDRHGDAPTKVVACLLALFLGLFGAHHFYLGATSLGVLYLVLNIFFFWTLVVPLVFGVICLIEGLVYLTYSDSAFAQKYRRR